jgi:hypothetical protein
MRLKQAERTRIHITIAGDFRKQLELSLDSRRTTVSSAGGEVMSQLKSIGSSARDRHRAEWNWKTGKNDKNEQKLKDPLFPLYWFFIVLNLLVSILGVAIWIIAP